MLRMRRECRFYILLSASWSVSVSSNRMGAIGILSATHATIHSTHTKYNGNKNKTKLNTKHVQLG